MTSKNALKQPGTRSNSMGTTQSVGSEQLRSGQGFTIHSDWLRITEKLDVTLDLDWGKQEFILLGIKFNVNLTSMPKLNFEKSPN